MYYWVYSKLIITGPRNDLFEFEIWKDRGEFPKYGYFVQPPQKEDLKKMEDHELIDRIFKAEKNLQGRKVDFKVGKE